MADNPYTPPASSLAVQPASPASTAKAILAGVALDMLGSGISYMVLDFMYDTGRERLEFSNKTFTLLIVKNYSLIFDSLTILAGFGCSILGGFICARLLHAWKPRTTLIQAGITAGLGLPLQSMQFSTPLILVLMLRTCSGVMLGAFFGGRRQNFPAT